MLVMGIESTAHTFGVGIVSDGKIIANEKEMYKIGTEGMIPSKVAEYHINNAPIVVERALKSAGVNLNEIEGIGYACGPGLGPCLQVGELTAKSIATRLGIKIAQVNHPVAHVEVARKHAKMKDPLVLYVSGGNSQILKTVRKPFLHYSVFGETMDIGVGNMLDNFARALKLNPAWGSTVAKTAENGKYVPLPYTVKGTEFSFTGLLTSATKHIGSESARDLCYSIQETAFAMLCEATERVMMLTNAKELCVCGGVGQSTRLKEMLAAMATSHNAKLGFAPNEFNADNGAMIAVVAEDMLRKGMSTKISECSINQRYRIDRAELAW